MQTLHFHIIFSEQFSIRQARSFAWNIRMVPHHGNDQFSQRSENFSSEREVRPETLKGTVSYG